MIKDSAELARLKAGWAGFSAMRERMGILVAGTFVGGAFTAPALAGVVYNLPLLLAYDVLADVLRASRKQGDFRCKSAFLGPMMKASRNELDWVDWDVLRNGVDLRNAVAHDGALHDAGTCATAMDAVQRQLEAWKVL
jgi:hypothetical protein